MGLLSKFLLEKARLFWEAIDLKAFEEVLALLIYGLILFPNPDQLIDVNVVNIFPSRNPVPTLLGDILHSLHTHTMRRIRTLMCCMSLLSRWFISHLPRSILKNEQGLRWSQRLMSLSHTNIHWCSQSQEDIAIIDCCGDFPNVPLLGIRGGITYNPSLALQQFGYARRDSPHDAFIQGIVFDYENDVQGYHQRFVHA